MNAPSSHQPTPLHSNSPSILTHFPLTTARSHPIITAKILHPVLETVQTTASLVPRTARSIRYALPTNSRNRSASAVGGRLVSGDSTAVAGTEDGLPRDQNIPAKKPPSQPTVSSMNFRIAGTGAVFGVGGTLAA